jgi:hypothetical protein
MPRVAALLDTQQISDVMKIEDENSKQLSIKPSSKETHEIQHLCDLYTLAMRF